REYTFSDSSKHSNGAGIEHSFEDPELDSILAGYNWKLLSASVRQAQAMPAQEFGWPKQPGAAETCYALTLGGAAAGGLTGYQPTAPNAPTEERLKRATKAARSGCRTRFGGRRGLRRCQGGGTQ